MRARGLSGEAGLRVLRREWLVRVARRVDAPQDLASALAECLAYPGPFFLDVRVAPEENCYPMMPAGCGHHEIMLGDGMKGVVTGELPVLGTYCERNTKKSLIFPNEPSTSARSGELTIGLEDEPIEQATTRYATTNLHVVEPSQRIRTSRGHRRPSCARGELRLGERVLRVFSGSAFEELHGLAQTFFGALVQVVAALGAEVARGEVFR